MESENSKGRPATYYWANETDREKLLAHLKDRRKEYQKNFTASGLLPVIFRNYQYFYGQFFAGRGSNGEGALYALGEQGEYVGASVNEFSSLVEQMWVLATQDKPAFEAHAVNSEQESLTQADLGEDVLNSYTEYEHRGRFFKLAVLKALIYLKSWLWQEWDPNGGRADEVREMDVDEEMLALIEKETQAGEGDDLPEERVVPDSEGDIRHRVVTPLDVAYDLSIRDEEDIDWVQVRKQCNIWDLVKLNPDLREEILECQGGTDENYEDDWGFSWRHMQENREDRVWVWCFYHRKTAACPFGHEMFVIDDKVLLKRGPLPYRKIPLFPCAQRDLFETTHGWSSLVDLQNLNEALNGEISSILSNHAAFGTQVVWTQEPLKASQVEGMVMLEGQTEPKGINFTQVAPDAYRLAELLVMSMERTCGVNGVARGQPHDRDASGTALALIDTKAVQFMSGLQASYYRLLAEAGTEMLDVLRNLPDEEQSRVITVSGKHRRGELVEWKPQQLKGIDRVIVKPGSPLLQTTSGRLEVANMLREQGMLSTPQEIINLIESGNMDPLYEAEKAQLVAVRTENEALLDGEQIPPPLAVDNHVLHIREHAAALARPSVRADPAVAGNVLSHISMHVQELLKPGTSLLMTVLGFPAVPTAGGAGGGPSPAPKSEPEGQLPPPGPGEELPDSQVNARDQGADVQNAQMPEPAEPPGVPVGV